MDDLIERKGARLKQTGISKHLIAKRFFINIAGKDQVFDV